MLRQPETSLAGGRYEDFDYACSYGDRLPAPSPVYSRHGYVQVRSSLGNAQGTVDWYARSDGDGHFEPERYHDNLHAPEGRSPYRQPYDESSANRSRDPGYDSPRYGDREISDSRKYDHNHRDAQNTTELRRYGDYDHFVNRSRDWTYDLRRYGDRPDVSEIRSSYHGDDGNFKNRSRDAPNCYGQSQTYDQDRYDGRCRTELRGCDEYVHSVNRSHHPPDCYRDHKFPENQKQYDVQRDTETRGYDDEYVDFVNRCPDSPDCHGEQEFPEKRKYDRKRYDAQNKAETRRYDECDHFQKRSRSPVNCYGNNKFPESQGYDQKQYDARNEAELRGYDEYVVSVNRSRDALGSYYDDAEGRYLDGGPAGSLVYTGTTPASRLPDGQNRRNGGIGYDWTYAAPPPDRKSANRKSSNRKSPDRKSGYGDDSVLIIGESGELYTTVGGADDRPSPFDYNTGTIQRRAAGTKSSSPYPDEPRSAVDGMERRLPLVQLALNRTDSAKPTAAPHMNLVPNPLKLSEPEIMWEQKLVIDGRLPVQLALNHTDAPKPKATTHMKLVPESAKRGKPEDTSQQKLVADCSERRHPVQLALDHTDFAEPSATPYTKLVSDRPTCDQPEAKRRLPVGTESASESPYRKEKDRGAPRDSPYRGGATTTATATTTAGKNTTAQSRGVQGRAKVVDDIQRLTERDRVPPAAAAQNRKQQQQNHVTSRGDESAKPSRSRGHKTTSTIPVSTTSG